MSQYSPPDTGIGDLRLKPPNLPGKIISILRIFAARIGSSGLNRVIKMITNEYGANHLIITKALRLGSELAFVADSGLWIGHCFALVAGNRYKDELRNTAILHSTKNAPVPRNRGMVFRYRDLPEYPGTYTLCGGWRRSRGTLSHHRPLL